MVLGHRSGLVAWGASFSTSSSILFSCGLALAQEPAPTEPPPPLTPPAPAEPLSARSPEPSPEPSPETELGLITVTGQRHVDRIEAGPLGSRTILETPFSIGQVDAEQISRVAATTIDAAFNYDASTRSANSGVASGNYFTVRGQLVDRTNGYKYDGLAFPYWFQDHPIEAVSEIQVLKGAGGFIYGYAPPSGIVNFVPKKPTDELLVSTNLSLRSSTIWRAHVDIGGPLREGGSTKFRLNAVHEEGTLYNGADNKNQFVTLWVEGDIVPGLTWSVDGFYQRTWQQNQSNGISITTDVTKLKPVSGKLNLAAPSTTKWNDIAQLTGRLNYEITKNWNAHVALRYSGLDERFPGNSLQIINNAGDYRSGLLNQNRIFFYYVGQATIDGKFNTGPVHHNPVLGFDYLDVNFDYDFQPYVSNGRPTTTYTFNQVGNLYDPRVPDWGSDPKALAFQRPPNWFRYQEIRQRGLFVSDTAKLGHAELLAGFRYTNYKESNYEPVIEDTKYSENAVTPVAALSYDLFEGARVYASYAQALQRGAQAPQNAANFGETFGPLKSTQYEAGVKAEQKTWGATLAAYRSTIPSEFLAAPREGEALGRWVREGESRFQGVEVEGNVQPQQWLLNVSLAYLDAKQTKALDPAIVGKRVPGTTAFQVSGFVQYEPSYIPGFRLFGGIRHSGKAYGHATNAFVFSPVTLGDVGAGYVKPVGKSEVQLQANLQNVTNERYWIPNATGTGLSPGAPFTFSVSLGLTTGGPGSGAAEAAASSGADAKAAGATVPSANHWYIGLDAGVATFAATDYDLKARVNPNLGGVENGLEVKHNVGWEVGGALGYDLGLFRSEFEVSHKKATLKQVTLKSAQVPVDEAGSATGTYDEPGGTTRVLAFLLNGLFEYGGDERTPWALQAGGGIGLARFNTRPRWELVDDAFDTAFQADNATGFAWQLLAAVRRRLTDRVDLSLKYRFFEIPNQTLFTANANALEGTLRSHSVLLGTGINF